MNIWLISAGSKAVVFPLIIYAPELLILRHHPPSFVTVGSKRRSVVRQNLLYLVVVQLLQEACSCGIDEVFGKPVDGGFDGGPQRSRIAKHLIHRVGRDSVEVVVVDESEPMRLPEIAAKLVQADDADPAGVSRRGI